MSTYVYQTGMLNKCAPRIEEMDGMDEGEWMRAGGYNDIPCIVAGGDDSDFSEVVVYAGLQDTKFLALLRIIDEWHTVYLDSLSDLIHFRQSYCAPADIRALFEGINTLIQIAEKAFCAWHGHDAQECCHDCDPRLTEERIRAIRRK